MSSRFTRVIAVGFLLLALASNVLLALPPDQGLRRETPAESGGIVATAWKWLVLILAPSPEPADSGASSARSMEGSQLDPDGHH